MTALTTRFDIRATNPVLATTLYSVTLMLDKSRFGKRLKHLMDLKISHLNGCLFCIEKHTEEGIGDGIPAETLTLMAGDDWQGSPVLTDAEKEAIGWADGLTRGMDEAETDSRLARLRLHYTEQDIGTLIMITAMMNAWNRVGRAGYSHALPDKSAA